MSKWIVGRWFDGRTIKAERHIWQINIHQKFFTDVCLIIVDIFKDNLCKICLENHISQSGLIKCLKSHRQMTVNYYLDHILNEDFYQ